MRKLYALLAGLFFILASNNIKAQNPPPDVANFTFTIQTGNNVSFTNTSTLGTAAGFRRAYWHFGDGTSQVSAPLANMQHHYNSSGTYTVCLKIYLYSNSSNDSILTSQVCKTVALQTNCTADFQYIDSLVPGTTNTHIVKFSAIGMHTQNRPIAEVCWNFGDGTPIVCVQAGINVPPATLLQIQHTYTQAGPYNACVKIRYQEGCIAEKCRVVQFQTSPPDSCRAAFERIPLNSTTDPRHATFKALPWHSNNKKPYRICWTFGDGRDTCIQYPATFNGPYLVNHTYTSPGLYQVCVKIQYEGGCQKTTCESVRIEEPVTCRADYERIPVTSINDPLVVGFRALPWITSNQKPSRICWEFGDGRDTCINYPQNYTGPYIVSHRYNQPGQYEVCVKIVYYGGCEARKCRLITVTHPPITCAVNISEISPSITGLTRGFIASVQSQPASRPIQICWNFGDGTDTCINISPSQPIPNLSITHTYPGPGVYNTCVRVKFQNNCVAEKCREVVIRPPANTCGGYMIDSLAGPRTFKFKGFSIHSPGDEVISFRWTFGDGTSALGQNVTHTYNVPGEYNVCLTIITRLGCETRICKKIRVPGSGQSILILTPNPVLHELHAQFQSTHTETVTIRILNQFGTVVRTYTRNAVVGSNTWGFDLSTLMPGIYTFTIQSPNQLASGVFIKL